MPRSAPLVLLLLAAGLAGCSGGEPATPTAPTLTFGTMSVATVPLEPWEARGVIGVDWTPQGFAVWTQGEGGMPAMAVRDGGTLFTSNTGMGWARWDLDAYVTAEARGFRYLAWDARALLAAGTVTKVEDGLVEADSSFKARGTTHPVALSITHEAGKVLAVVITTPADAEAPFTLTGTETPLPFSPVPPAGAVEGTRLDDLQGTASDNHAHILGWIDEYVGTLGRVPTSVTPDSLALQRLDEPWPVNPFDQRPVEARAASGHFAWKICSAQDGQYQGYGLDGEVLGKAYGRGCPA